MLRALRLVSVERGHDPRDFALVAFGERGRCTRAPWRRSSGSGRCWCPRRPECSPRSGWQWATSGATALSSYVCALDEAGELPAAGEADLRYAGQSFELTVPLEDDLAGAFHRAHEARYGYADRVAGSGAGGRADGRRERGAGSPAPGGRAAGGARPSAPRARRRHMLASPRVGGG